MRIKKEDVFIKAEDYKRITTIIREVLSITTFDKRHIMYRKKQTALLAEIISLREQHLKEEFYDLTLLKKVANIYLDYNAKNIRFFELINSGYYRVSFYKFIEMVNICRRVLEIEEKTNC